MKKVAIFILTFILIAQGNAQNNRGAAAAAAIGGLALIGGGIALNEKMKEMAELTAAQYLLSHNLEGNNFHLKVLDMDAEKGSSESSAGIRTFTLRINNTIGMGESFEPRGKKYVMLYLSLNGGINDYGTRLDKDKWLVLDFDGWLDLFSEYVMLASFQDDKATLVSNLKTATLGSDGIKQNRKTVVPFFKVDGDTYISKNYDDNYKLVFNEKSMGFFVKDTEDLILLGRKDMTRIQEFFVEE
jgi:hypothetical protein